MANKTKRKPKPKPVLPPKISLKRRIGVRVLRVMIWSSLLFVLLTTGLVAALRWVNPPMSAFMVSDLVSQLLSNTESPGYRYRWVDYDQISPEMALAVIAAEDQKFPAHGGFDWQSMRAAFSHNREGGAVRGGSTISQQVAKNLFLWSGRSYVRKALEGWFTFLIESLWPKQRILETYLNIAQWGENLYGVGAASHQYFNRSAAQLDLSQAALLASVLPNPVLYRVNKPSARVKVRQRWILRQMRQLGGRSFLGNL